MKILQSIMFPLICWLTNSIESKHSLTTKFSQEELWKSAFAIKKEPKDWLMVVCIKWRYMIISITKRAFNNAPTKI